MTPAQQRIADCLAGHPGRWVGAFELRDETQAASEKSIHVQIHKMRAAGFVVESSFGPRGGYRLAAQAA